jgi:hypothetical protein
MRTLPLVFLVLPSMMLSPALHPLAQIIVFLHGRLLCVQLLLPRFVLHLAYPCPFLQTSILHSCVVTATSLTASVTLPSRILKQR